MLTLFCVQSSSLEIYSNCGNISAISWHKFMRKCPPYFCEVYIVFICISFMFWYYCTRNITKATKQKTFQIEVQSLTLLWFCIMFYLNMNGKQFVIFDRNESTKYYIGIKHKLQNMSEDDPLYWFYYSTLPPTTTTVPTTTTTITYTTTCWTETGGKGRRKRAGKKKSSKTNIVCSSKDDNYYVIIV